MASNNMTTLPYDTTAEFDRELTELILSAFGYGADIEGTWEIDVPVSTAPNWTVTITKDDGDTDPTYEPTILEE